MVVHGDNHELIFEKLEAARQGLKFAADGILGSVWTLEASAPEMFGQHAHLMHPHHFLCAEKNTRLAIIFEVCEALRDEAR